MERVCFGVRDIVKGVLSGIADWSALCISLDDRRREDVLHF